MIINISTNARIMKKHLILFVIIFCIGSLWEIGSAGDIPFTFKFGLMKKDAMGRYMVYKETTNIPGCLSGDQHDLHFGFFIEFPRPTTFTEQHVLILPKPPRVFSEQFWQSSPSQTVFRSPQIERRLVTWHNMYLTFDVGDPLGEWTLELYLNGKLRKTIQFNVVKCHNP
jgi:hypothetical protein